MPPTVLLWEPRDGTVGSSLTGEMLAEKKACGGGEGPEFS